MNPYIYGLQTIFHTLKVLYLYIYFKWLTIILVKCWVGSCVTGFFIMGQTEHIKSSQFWKTKSRQISGLWSLHMDEIKPVYLISPNNIYNRSRNFNTSLDQKMWWTKCLLSWNHPCNHGSYNMMFLFIDLFIFTF